MFSGCFPIYRIRVNFLPVFFNDGFTPHTDILEGRGASDSVDSVHRRFFMVASLALYWMATKFSVSSAPFQSTSVHDALIGICGQGLNSQSSLQRR